MAERSRDRYQGLLLPDARLRDPDTALWALHSSYTQRGPRPGVPQAQADTELVLESGGEQAAASEVWARAVRGGMPGRSGRSGAFAWRKKGDAATNYRGWEGPCTSSAWEAIDWTTGNGFTQPHAVTLQTPAYRDRVVVAASGTNNVECFYRDPSAGTWSQVSIDSTTLTSAHPCLVEIGDRLYCLYWVKGQASASTALYIRVSVSTDGGATWSIARRYATIETDVVESGPSSSQYQAGRIRAAALDGQVLVVARLLDGSITGAASAEVFRQYASSDLTTSLLTRSTWDPANDEGGQFDLVAAGGRFVLAYVKVDGVFYWRIVGSAYSLLEAALEDTPPGTTWELELAEVGTGPGGGSSEVVDDADVAMCVDDAGILWLFLRYAEVSGFWESDGITLLSPDAGESWEPWGNYTINNGRVLPGRWWRSEDTTQHPLDIAVTFQRGRAVMVGNADLSSSSADETLWAAYLGGYHNLTLPPIREDVLIGDRVTWDHSTWPLVTGANGAAWTNTATGTNSSTLGATGETITSGDGAGNAGNHYNKHTDAVTGDIVCEAHWNVEASGVPATTQSYVAVRIRLDDGTTGVEISANVSSSGIELWDEVAGASLATATGLAEADREYRIGVYKNEGASVKSVQLFYRDYDTSEDKEWITVGGPQALANDAGSIGSNFIWWGNVVSAGAGTQVVSRWGMGPPRFSFGNIASLHQNAGSANWWHAWVAANDNPGNLSGRNYSGNLVYVADKTTLRAVDGPAFRGDEHLIATRYDSPIERVFSRYSRSPRSPFRTVDDASAAVIALQFDPTLSPTVDSVVGAPVYGFAILNTNIRSFDLEYRDASGAAWTAVATFDLASGMVGLPFTRKGASYVPNGDEALSFAAAELVGWDVRTIAASPSDVVRRIVGSSPGRWATGTSAGPRVRLHVDKAATTDPASGNLALCPRSAVCLFHFDPSIDAAGWRITIPAQDTVEGYFEIGNLVPGPVYVTGLPPAWGHSTAVDQGYQRSESSGRQGTLDRTAPPQRVEEIAWPDGIDTTSFHADDEPDFATTTDTSGIEGAVQVGATAYDLQHLVEDLQGDAVVYLKRIPRSDGSADEIVLNRRDQFIYGTIEGEVERSTLVGDEWNDEVVTVGRVTIREEV